MLNYLKEGDTLALDDGTKIFKYMGKEELIVTTFEDEFLVKGDFVLLEDGAFFQYEDGEDLPLMEAADTLFNGNINTIYSEQGVVKVYTVDDEEDEDELSCSCGEDGLEDLADRINALFNAVNENKEEEPELTIETTTNPKEIEEFFNTLGYSIFKD